MLFVDVVLVLVLVLLAHDVDNDDEEEKGEEKDFGVRTFWALSTGTTLLACRRVGSPIYLSIYLSIIILSI